jgi:hypothetical protein
MSCYISNSREYSKKTGRVKAIDESWQLKMTKRRRGEEMLNIKGWSPPLWL